MRYIRDSRITATVGGEEEKKFPFGLIIIGLGVAGVITATLIAKK